MPLSMLSRWGEGRPGIGGGFDSSHRPIVGTFDRFDGLSSNISLPVGVGVFLRRENRVFAFSWLPFWIIRDAEEQGER